MITMRRTQELKLRGLHGEPVHVDRLWEGRSMTAVDPVDARSGRNRDHPRLALAREASRANRAVAPMKDQGSGATSPPLALPLKHRPARRSQETT